jgi:hypothetical protein
MPFFRNLLVGFPEVRLDRSPQTRSFAATLGRFPPTTEVPWVPRGSPQGGTVHACRRLPAAIYCTQYIQGG